MVAFSDPSTFPVTSANVALMEHKNLKVREIHSASIPKIAVIPMSKNFKPPGNWRAFFKTAESRAVTEWCS